MRARVKDDPRHRDRILLKRYERRLKDGPLMDPAAFSLISDSRWRLVDDPAEVWDGSPGMFIDSGENGTDGWLAKPKT